MVWSDYYNSLLLPYIIPDTITANSYIRVKCFRRNTIN